MTRPRNNPSTELRNPALELMTDQRQKIYIAALERRLIILSIRDVQLRSALEAATGRAYDTFDPANMNFKDICEVVAGDLARGLNITIKDARDRVQENVQTANP